MTGLSPTRTAVQAASFLGANLHFSGWITGVIYQGVSKMFFVPGIWCYSTPSAVLSCPAGSLQAVLASPGVMAALTSGRPDALALLAPLGFIAAVGLAGGRLACGWICPFGFIQDLLYRIPFPGIRIPEGFRPLKYVMLAFFLVLLPLLFRASPETTGDPWFCKAVCPAGTSLAGWPLVSGDTGGVFRTGFLFAWKSALAVAVLILGVSVERPFCRYLCPLGAAWGLLGRAAVLRMRVSDRCTRCGMCGSVCPMGIEIWRRQSSPECIRCMKCLEVCPVKAISHGP